MNSIQCNELKKKMKATLHVVEEFQQMNLPGNVAIAPERIPIDLGSSSANSLMMIVNSVAVLVSMEKKKNDDDETALIDDRFIRSFESLH